MSDESKRSVERAKESALVLAASGLNALLPGAGPIGLRLTKHIAEIVLDARLRRVEEFHRRVFEGDEIPDDQINARFAAMKDEDFATLLATMLADVEAEKVPIYAAAYIHLVESATMMTKNSKLDFAYAITNLRLSDFEILARLSDAGGVGTGGRKSVTSVEKASPQGTTQRLAHVGAFTTGIGPHAPTDFGRELVRALATAIHEALARRHP